MIEDYILDENLDGEQTFIPVSNGKRLANYFIDAIIFYVLVFVLVFFIPDTSLTILDGFGENIISMLGYAIFYCFYEGGLGGKIIGKYITRMRVLSIDGYAPDAGHYIKRSFSRIVPFEAFSFLGERSNGWHDRWSDTMVIDEKLSTY